MEKASPEGLALLVALTPLRLGQPPAQGSGRNLRNIDLRTKAPHR